MKSKLKILMCSQFPLKNSLGGPKGYIEIAETYRSRGHHVDLIGIDTIVGEGKPYLDELWRIHHFPEYLKNYLIKYGNNYDIIEYEAIYLPFDMKPWLQSKLVARSVLLELHLKQIKIPRFPGIRSLLGHLTKSAIRRRNLNQRINQFLKAMSFANVVNVSNPSDVKILCEYGVDPTKIVMQPYGISQRKLDSFKEVRAQAAKDQDDLIIAFVGSFDKRKGAVEFPQIMRSLVKRYPKVRFKLLGVLGMFPDVESIYDYLGADLREKVFIQAKYHPDELPHLLSNCSMGVFPSYLESFGFGALEMMAMGLPVAGYDSPGLNMLIPRELIAPRGNVKGITELLSKLIERPDFYKRCEELCSERVTHFIYETQQNKSLETYLHLVGNIN